jgi:NADH-quinone oxidoreductase subunit L
MAKVHESPKIMTIPLILLAAGAIFAGYFGVKIGMVDPDGAFWRGAILALPGHDALEAAHAGRERAASPRVPVRLTTRCYDCL